MDFLDPRKKRINSIKLMIGHTLMGLVVVIGTYLLVFQAYGFDVDKKTGEVYQNGLVFLDSAPDGANITINGSLQNGKTNRRIALPEGSYKVEISKDGYRSWAKDITVTGGKVDYYRYPMLIPTELTTKRVAQLDAKPALVLNSPDRRYVLVQNADSLTSFTQYDLNDLKSSIFFSLVLFYKIQLFKKKQNFILL